MLRSVLWLISKSRLSSKDFPSIVGTETERREIWALPNRPYMTSFSGGSSAVFYKLALWCVSALLLTPLAHAAPAERTLWIYDHFAESPRATLATKTRYQLTGQMSHFSETVALRLQGVLDLRFLEVVLSGNQLLFPSDSQKSNLVKEPLYSTRQSLGVELARYFATETRHYGRFSLGSFHFFPERETWLGIGLETGVLPSDLGWEFGLRARLLVPLRREERFVLLKTQVLRSLDWLGKNLNAQLGGMVSWVWALRDTNAPGNYEHMLVTVGPVLDVSVGGNSHLQAGLQFRLWMDKLVEPGTAALAETTTSEMFGVPAVFVNWSWSL